MKKLSTIFLFLIFLFSNNVFSQVIDEGFEMATCTVNPFYNGCVEDWISTHGKASIIDEITVSNQTVTAYEGDYFTRLRVLHRQFGCPDNPLRGDGIALNYPFEAGVKYKISYAMRKPRGGEQVHASWILVDDMENQTGPHSWDCTSGDILPDVPEPNQYVEMPNITRFWVHHEQEFTANEDFSQLWFKTYIDGPTDQETSSAFLDAIKIEPLCVEEPIAYQFEQADGTPDTEFTLCEYVFIDASATTLPITSYTLDIRELDENGAIVGYNVVFDLNHPHLGHAYGQPGDHMNITDIFQYPNTDNSFDFVEGHSYRVKIETWDVYCNHATWTYEDFTIIESNCCEEAIQFHFEHEDGTEDNIFSTCEEVFLDATGTNDSRGSYYLAIKEFDENGIETNFNRQHTNNPNEGSAWGDAGDERISVSAVFTDLLTENPIDFMVGYTYQVELALWINNCGGWTGLTHDFTFTDEDCSDEDCDNLSAPTDLYTLPSISLNWEAVEGADYYIVSSVESIQNTCTCKNPADFSSVLVPGNYYNLPLSLVNECFMWRVRAVCSDGEQSPFSEKACFGGFERPKIISFENNTNTTSIYPNPSNGKVTLSVNISYDSDVQIELYDMLGHQVKSFNETLQVEENNTVTLNWDGTGQLTKGIYFFRFHTDLETFTKIVVIE